MTGQPLLPPGTVAPDVPRLRTRTMRLLFAGVALGTTGFFSGVTVLPLVAEEVTGTTTWAGIPITFGIVGTALGSSYLSRLMARRGRRSGLAFGYLLGAAGIAVVIAAHAAGVFLLLLAAMVVVGAGNSSNQLARYAAADVQPPHRRASALGLVVWAGTVGALLGPNLVSPFGGIAEALGLPRLSGPFLLMIVTFGAASVLYTIGMRPDPSGLADTTETDVDAAPAAGTSILRRPSVQIALASLVTAQVVMLFIMTMTPIHIRDGGGGLGVVGFVMSAHVVGMYGLAPVAGRLADRFGPVGVIGVGMAMLVASGAGAAMMPATAGALLAAPLFLLGLGWSFSFVAGSSLLTYRLALAERVRLQGTADTVVWTSAAGASLASGIVLAAVGYAILAVIGACLVALPVVVIAGRRRAFTAQSVPSGG